MIRVNIMYPKKKGVKFNHEYYLNNHVPLIKERYGNALKRIEVYQGIRKMRRNLSPFAATASLWFDSVEDFRTNFEKHGKELMQDRANFSKTSPLIQIEKELQG